MKCFGGALRVSFGIPYGHGDFPLAKFMRHVSYMILVNIEARGKYWGGNFFF